MNAAILVMSSALASGGDVVPAGWGERALPAAHAGGCCAPAPTVPAPCDPCCDSGRTKLLDRLKSKLVGKKGSDCCAAPAPAYYQPNLLDKMKQRWGSKNACECPAPCPPPACGPACAPAAVPVPHDPPKDVPKDMKDAKPKPDPEPAKKGGNAGAAVAPSPVPLPPLPAAPLSGPRLSGTASPY